MILDFKKSNALIKCYKGFKKNPSLRTLNELLEHMNGLRYSSHAVKVTLKAPFLSGWPSEKQKPLVVAYWKELLKKR